MSGNVQTADDLEPPTKLHRIGTFGPNPAERAQGWTREKARKKIRANSDRGPSFFNRLDGAFKYGYLNPRPDDDTSVRANSQIMDYEEWVDESDNIIEEVEIDVTLLDDALGIDQVSHDLSYTIYTEQMESEGDMGAEITMDGQSKGRDGGSAKVPVGVAVPIVVVDYRIGGRAQSQSANMGNDLVERKARGAGREIRYTEDELMLNGWGMEIDGPDGGTFTVDGYLTTDARVQGSATGTWTASSLSNVQDTVEKMVNALETQGNNSDRNIDPRARGVFLYYNTAHNSVLDKADPRGDGSLSVRQRLLQDHPYLSLRGTPRIPEGEVLMVVRDPEVLSVINAQSPTNMSWEAGPMATNYKALSSRVPFFRSTWQDVTGIAHYTGV